MSTIISSKTVALVFGILTVSFLAAFYVIAWTEPSQAPPGGNVPTPLNVGATGQSKIGGLILNTGGAVNGLIVDQGKVGIGVTSPEGKLEVRGEIRTTGPNAASLNCPIWKDCDGDTYTPGYKDCNESCTSCYQGSPSYSCTPDGFDQDCDGTIDNQPAWWVVSYGYGECGVKTCPTGQIVSTPVWGQALADACQSYCLGLGMSPDKYAGTRCEAAATTAYTSFNFSTCAIGGSLETRTQQYCALQKYIPPNPYSPDYEVTCYCKGYR